MDADERGLGEGGFAALRCIRVNPRSSAVLFSGVLCASQLALITPACAASLSRFEPVNLAIDPIDQTL